MKKIFKDVRLCVMLGVVGCAGVSAWAQTQALQVLYAVEPTARRAALDVSQPTVEAALGRAVGREVELTVSQDLTDAMRATRSTGYDVFIGPAQIAASALARGYELLGATSPSEAYVLVSRTEFKQLAALKGQRLYLPQQDSIYSYMARGLLNQAGLSMQQMQVRHERIPQAGLTALSLGVADATVVRASDWEAWLREQPAQAHVLSTLGGVPGGVSVVVSKSLPAEQRQRLSAWFAAPASRAGLPSARYRAEAADYQRVAELGIFTPTSLPGVTRVSAQQALKLQQGGAVIVDTRIKKEFDALRIAGAVWLPYHEKSLKDVAFKVEQDDFSALDKAAYTKTQALVFSCNGAECWKSYKAAKWARAGGYSRVYWLRGGLPEWKEQGLPLQPSTASGH
ncbi:rhodanese-like domain-containing protein [Roseateles sp. BYS180W]|uniref:Rhodanese-like domain-containing protein n=1 Tax=Roseateles rivi TaxID=3299028 RepID=A0ABW7FYH6_9BURK